MQSYKIFRHMQEKKQNISPIKQRFLQFADTLGISMRDFYIKTGVSRGTLENSTGINEETMTKIFANFSDLSPNWVVTGEGPMLKSVEKEVENSSVPVMIKSYPKPQKQSEGIPLVNISAAAGFGTFDICIEEKNIVAKYVIPDFNGADLMIPIVGDSMEPKYTAGDIVACKIIKDNKYIQWGKVYIVATKTQGFMLKRLYSSNIEEYLECKSYNPEYPPFLIEKDEISGIALVIGSVHLEAIV